MNEVYMAKGGINITGFQLLNYTHLQNSNDNERLKWDWPDNVMSVCNFILMVLCVFELSTNWARLKTFADIHIIVTEDNENSFGMGWKHCRENKKKKLLVTSIFLVFL